MIAWCCLICYTRIAVVLTIRPVGHSAPYENAAPRMIVNVKIIMTLRVAIGIVAPFAASMSRLQCNDIGPLPQDFATLYNPRVINFKAGPQMLHDALLCGIRRTTPLTSKQGLLIII